MTGHRIDVLGQRFFAHHGCLPEEAIIGQEYVVDVRIWVDLTPSAESDDLAQTVDYVDVHKICAREMAIRSKLVEHVKVLMARRIKVTSSIRSVMMPLLTVCSPLAN